MSPKLGLFSFFFVFIFACSFCSASTYAVKRKDGGVTILHYNENSKDTLQDVLEEMGFADRPIISVSEADLPETNNDREAWTISGGRVVVDPIRKTAKQAEKQEKKERQAATLSKIGLNQSDVSVLADILKNGKTE